MVETTDAVKILHRRYIGNSIKRRISLKKEKWMVFFENAKSFHHRIMARFLRKRGWVVFFLEEEARNCNDMCWLKLYREQEKREVKCPR